MLEAQRRWRALCAESRQGDMPIHTVLGPIESCELGLTSMHEHVLIDGRVWLTPPLEPMPADPAVCLENIGFLRWNLVSLEDNLVLDDVDLAVDELKSLVAARGSGIVDLTDIGLGRRVADLVGVSRRTGLHVMVGRGFYVDAAHPEWARAMTVDELAALLIRELDEGIDDTQIRPALLGEIGTSAPVTPQEVKVLEAVAIAGAHTGSAISIHLDARGTEAIAILEILGRHGVDPGRVIFGHLDEHLDRAYHEEVAASGAVIEFDTFGTDMYWAGLFKDPSDVERREHLSVLLENGHEERIVLGCDVWTRTNLRHNGGFGYAHLLRRIVPALERDFHIDYTTLEKLLTTNPRRLLDRP